VNERGNRKVVVGTVVSDKSDKTVVVRVTRRLRHQLYGKFVSMSKKYHAHDEANDAHEGDTVRLIEVRPMSRLKRWRVVEIVKRAV
jgi:small subunit ribosomal protein S17